jgi:hypothetical protein
MFKLPTTRIGPAIGLVGKSCWKSRDLEIFGLDPWAAIVSAAGLGQGSP